MQNSFTTSLYFSVALSYDQQTRITSAFIHGLRDSKVDPLTVQLIENRSLHALPALLPYLLLNMGGSFAMTTSLQCNQQILAIEYGTGVVTYTDLALVRCCSKNILPIQISTSPLTHLPSPKCT